jgi:hypothetical protein
MAVALQHEKPQHGVALPVSRYALSPCIYDTPLLESGLLFGCGAATHSSRLVKKSCSRGEEKATKRVTGKQ